jgi:hypothetical protein
VLQSKIFKQVDESNNIQRSDDENKNSMNENSNDVAISINKTDMEET